MAYDAERKAEIEKCKALNAKFRLVLAELKLTEVKKEKDEYYHTANIEGENVLGEAIYLSANAYGKWRINVSGVYPRGREGEYLTVYKQVHKIRSDGSEYSGWDEVKSESITVSSDKTPAQIARDIERRFMPAYRERLRLCIAKLNEQIDYQSESETTLEKALGRRLTPEEAKRREYSFYHESGHLGHVKASGKRIDLEISEINADQARKIIQIIKEVKKDR